MREPDEPPATDVANQALRLAVEAWELQFGSLTEAEVAKAENLLDRAAKSPRPGMA